MRRLEFGRNSAMKVRRAGQEAFVYFHGVQHESQLDADQAEPRISSFDEHIKWRVPEVVTWARFRN